MQVNYVQSVLGEKLAQSMFSKCLNNLDKSKDTNNTDFPGMAAFKVEVPPTGLTQL